MDEIDATDSPAPDQPVEPGDTEGLAAEKPRCSGLVGDGSVRG